MVDELTLEERAAIAHAAQALAHATEASYAAGLRDLGDDTAASRRVLLRLLARDLQRATAPPPNLSARGGRT